MEKFKVTIENTDTGEQASYLTDDERFLMSCVIAAIAELTERQQKGETPA